MGKFFIPFTLVCAIFCACSSNVSNETPQNSTFADERTSPREQFFSDSLNASWKSRTYPVPDVIYTPAPKGYEPVYISSYARHGSRKLIGRNQTGRVLDVLDQAAQLNCLTTLGQEVLAKITVIDDDLGVADADLSSIGVEQHKGIAERMYLNNKNVFSHKNTPVRLYSTAIQRTMMSMFSENARLLELNPDIVSTFNASKGLTYLVRIPEYPENSPTKNYTNSFLSEYFDARPLLSRIFTEDMPALKDTAAFVNNLYSCAAITCGLDLEGVDFIWDVFTYDEMYEIHQALNYNWYVYNSNSPELGDFVVQGMSPLLRDFIDKADAALAEDIPGADLRFGHDSYLTSFSALIGLNGLVPKVDDPLKVIDIFQALNVAPMGGNVQMVFYRNREGDVIVKLLQNEREAFVPIDTDIYPYYHWDELRTYFESRIDLDYLAHYYSMVEQ